MAWKDNLRQGSFRGAEFFTEDVQTAGGRRAVHHQFPNREKPYAEDMGRAARVYTIQGHVIGDDYFEAKTRLLEVFEKKGAGELIHPYYGSLFVQVAEVNVSESTLEGAIAVFTAKFLEAGDNRFPKGVNDKAAVLGLNVDNALAEIKGDFDSTFSVDGMPGFSIDSARALIAKAQETFDETTKIFGDIAEGIADAAFATRNLIAETNDLLQSPSELSQRLLDSFKLMEDAISSSKSKTSAYSAFYSFSGDDPVEGDTPIREREKENESAFQNFMRRAAAVSSSNTAIDADYLSFEEAENARVSITDVIEEQVREIENTDGSLWQAMSDVNASVVEALPDVDADLPSLKEIEVENDTASLMLTHDLFESIENEQDIIDRNNIRHPGFIAKGTILEVLE